MLEWLELFYSNLVHLVMLAVLETYLENVALSLFTACKPAYLVVLTVNVIVVFLLL